MSTITFRGFQSQVTQDGFWDNPIEIKDCTDTLNTKRMLFVLGQVWGDFDMDIICRAIGDKNKFKKNHFCGILGNMNARGQIEKLSSGKWRLKKPIPKEYPTLTQIQIQAIKTHAHTIAKIKK